MDFKVSHIYHKGNCCDDSLSNIRIDNKQDFVLFAVLPHVLSIKFFCNRHNLPDFRFG